MSSVTTDYEDVSSLISLSSSTIFSNQTDDADSSSDSQDLHDQVNELVKQESRKNFEDIDERQKKKDSTSSILLDKTDIGAVASNVENQESEGLADGKTTEEYPFLKSVKYLEQHAILRLFQNLAADIVYNRPEQPLQYIIEKLEKQRHNKEHNEKDEDLEI